MTYSLQWTTGEGEPIGPATYILNPDHPQHDQNMQDLPRLQRRILRVYLEEVITSLDRTEPQ